VARRFRGGGRRTRQRRLIDWQNGFTVEACNFVAFDSLTAFELTSPFTEGPKVTLVRMVGQIHAVVKPASIAENVIDTDVCSTLHMGIQVVNRAGGIDGTSRDPSVPDDKEGGEWLWMDTRFAAWRVTSSGAGISPPDWYIPTHQVGSDTPKLDSKVKRKLDLSQDKLELTMIPKANFAVDWQVSVSIRLLFMLS